MTRECHVRFCERLRGQFLWPTHLFGMKAHIGADAESGSVHHVHGSDAKVTDVTEVAHQLHGVENGVCADAGYTGVEKRSRHEGRPVIWQIAARRSTYKHLGKRSALYKAKRKIEKAKAQVPAKVEHPFRVIKRQFGYVKTRFCGSGKKHSTTDHIVCAVEPVDGLPTVIEHCGRGAPLADQKQGKP